MAFPQDPYPVQRPSWSSPSEPFGSGELPPSSRYPPIGDGIRRRRRRWPFVLGAAAALVLIGAAVVYLFVIR
jgi:hypothetical protein